MNINTLVNVNKYFGINTSTNIITDELKSAHPKAVNAIKWIISHSKEWKLEKDIADNAYGESTTYICSNREFKGCLPYSMVAALNELIMSITGKAYSEDIVLTSYALDGKQQTKIGIVTGKYRSNQYNYTISIEITKTI